MENGRQRTRAEIAFHLGLAAILLPVIAVPFVWALAIRNLRLSSSDPEQRRWSRRLLGLAIVDTLVAIALVVASLTGMGQAVAERRSAEPARLGVLVDDLEEPGVLVREVFEGSPAREAGLLPGDRIVEANGRPIDDPEALVATMASGESTVLELERGGRALELEVTPRAGVEVPTVLPATDSCEAPSTTPQVSTWDLLPYALFLAAALGLAVWGRRRGVCQWTSARSSSGCSTSRTA